MAISWGLQVAASGEIPMATVSAGKRALSERPVTAEVDRLSSGRTCLARRARPAATAA